MKKKQVALLLAALMCITPVAESAAVMGAEFSSGEETVEMQGTEEEAEAEDTAEIWTSGEEVSDFGTDEAPEVDGFTSEESEASTDAAGAKQVKGSFEVAYITEEQYNNALQNEDPYSWQLGTGWGSRLMGMSSAWQRSASQVRVWILKSMVREALE